MLGCLVLQDHLSRGSATFSGFHDNPAIGASMEELVRGMEENSVYKHLEVCTVLYLCMYCTYVCTVPTYMYVCTLPTYICTVRTYVHTYCTYVHAHCTYVHIYCTYVCMYCTYIHTYVLYVPTYICTVPTYVRMYCIYVCTRASSASLMMGTHWYSSSVEPL